MSTFKRLEISKWQQFGEINIEFDRNVTILTGANASGKTTLLNLLSRHSGWSIPSLSVPLKDKVSEAFRWITRVFSDAEVVDEVVGTLTYGDGTKARLLVPRVNSAAYQLTVENQQPVACFYIPSHRSTYRYGQVNHILTSVPDKNAAYGRVASSNQGKYMGQGGQPANYHMKEVLLSWSIFGRGNVDMDADPNLLALYEGFQDTLRKLLPPTLGFQKLAIRNHEIVLMCTSGAFLLDGASGGISTLIDLAWQLYMYTPPSGTSFTALIDEVENHLHPTMQRRLLDDLISAFPHVRFIVSTHSPLIVTSLREAAVYALRYRGPADVVSQRLDLQGQVRTATEVLDEVLGVSSTMPLWAEAEIAAVMSAFTQGPLDENSFQLLREQLKKLGLADFMPQALGQLLDAKK